MTNSQEFVPTDRARFDASLDCYASLLRMLLPRVSAICLYDPAGETLWASAEGLDTTEIDTLVSERLQADVGEDACLAEGCRMDFPSGDAVYLAGLYAAEEDRLGVLAVSVPATAGQHRPWSLVQGLIQPVLQCLVRDLGFQRTLALQGDSAGASGSTVAERAADDSLDAERDLELLARLGEEDPTYDDPAGALGRLVERCREHFDVDVCALLVPGRNLRILRPAPDAVMAGPELLAKTQRNLLAMAQLHGRPFIANRLPRGQDGSGTQPQLPFRIMSCPIHDRSGQVEGVLALFGAPDGPEFADRQSRVLSLVARRAGALLHAGHDELTGGLTLTPFRRLVRETAQREGPHSVLFINVDRMHVVNDRFGLEAGDEVLVRVADLARDVLGDDGALCRLPGDQFAILLPSHDLEQARVAAERLLGSVAQLGYLREGQSIQMSLSIGAALVPLSQEPGEEVLAAAEVACRMAKDHGRGRVECYQEDDQSIIRRHTDITMLGQLHQALNDNEFVLHAQPLQCLRSGRLQGFEILVRLRDGDGTILAPDRFLSAAQRYGLMPALDRWVLENTLTALAPCAQDLDRHDLQVFINLSGQSLGDQGFADFLLQRVGDGRVPPARLCFEITESAAIARLSHARDLIERARVLGAQFALDDFGTGLSSFAYLHALPVSIVKIDGGFVRDINENRASSSMVTAIVQVARGLQLQTVAEYVESDLLRRRVASLGVDFAQGFHIGRPVPLERMLRALAARRPAAARADGAGAGQQAAVAGV
ncbi:MAG: EAL domain-containing protein [Gammaproteobacteria bacterium]|nr:EAL domain-containing protein [Gammaproteobacteria bacterium]